MTPFEIYVFFVCLIVFVLLTAFSAITLTIIYKYYRKLVELGVEDKAITEEYQRSKKKSNRIAKVIDVVVSLLLTAVVLVSFVFSMYLQTTEDKTPNGIPSLKVVQSGSMSEIHEVNTHLIEDNVTNQLQVFDLIVVRHIPDEFDLELYDIVMYENDDGKLVIHRIVEIDEPNAKHPDERYFVLQGDANRYPDKIPVYYSQMRGIYEGERIPFVGSFVMFLQSPAGWLCIALVIIGTIISPIMQRSLRDHVNARLVKIGVADPSEITKKRKKEEDQ